MTTAERWWNQATSDDAGNCRKTVFGFLDDPNPDDTEKWARALALYILLGGDVTAICDRVDKIQESPYMVRVRDALTTCEAKLLQAHVAMPERLQRSNEELIIRDEKAFAQRCLEILQAARRVRLRPRPK
jgi:hypothetical protein